MKIILCLAQLSLLVSLSTSVRADTPLPLPTTLATNIESCFRGDFSDPDKFVAKLEKKRPLTKERREQAQHMYRNWADNFVCLDFDYTVDSLTVRGFYLAPKKLAPAQKLPVVIYNRGGNADSGASAARYRLHKFAPLLDENFIIIGSQYRGARLTSEAHPDRLKDEFGGRDVNDVLALLPIIAQLPHANGGKIGIWGTSRGAMMAFLAAKQTDRFGALVAQAGVSDISAELAFRPEMEKVFNTWIPGYADNKTAELRKRSPLYWVEELPKDLPILLQHGARDPRVSPFSSLRLAERLQELERPYRLTIYEDGGHGLEEHHKEASRELVRWFRKYLLASAETTKPNQ